jgi:hypothetical protein
MLRPEELHEGGQVLRLGVRFKVTAAGAVKLTQPASAKLTHPVVRS